MTNDLTRGGTSPGNPAGDATSPPSPAVTRVPPELVAGAGTTTTPRVSAPSSSIFGPDALRAAIDAEFAAIPPGKSGALVGYYTTDGTWRVAVATRLGDRWQLGAVAQKDAATGQISGGFQVRATW